MARFGLRRAASPALAGLLLLAACGAPGPGEDRDASPRPVATATAAATIEATPAAPSTATPEGASPTPAVTATATAAATTPTPEPITLTIGAVGDLMFARDVVALMQQHGPDYAFERVAPFLAGNDLLIGNLEGTFTERGEPLEKPYTFRAPPALAEALRSAGFDAVSLANNHALDFGPSGCATRSTPSMQSGSPTSAPASTAARPRRR